MSLRLVNGYVCRNCADEELAKKGVDPAHPKKELVGSEVYVPPQPDPLRLGENNPETSGNVGRRLNVYA
ncbi:MAG: hypothetical protein QM756_01455 [Polyangiaceae bacterium]